MIQSNCKVSVITVSRNSATTIEQTIRSVLCQSYKNIEYIIIDGDSTDGTQRIIEKYKDSLAYYVSEKDDGLYYAMNKGISKATGDIIGIINSDDWYADNIVKDVVNFFEANDVELLYGKVICVSEDNEETEDLRAPLENIWYQMPLAHPSVFAKKSIYDKFGAFNVNYRVTSDYELMLRLYVENIKFKFIDKVCAYFRLGGLSSTHAKERQEDIYKISMSYIDKCPNKDIALPKIEEIYRLSMFTDMVLNNRDAFYKLLCDRFLENVNNIIIFGTGIWGERCYKALEGTGVTVSHFADNDQTKWNTEFLGIEVIKPENLKKMAAYVLIAVKESGREIGKQLSDMNNSMLKYICIDELVKYINI